jgi:hypothetical protein
LEQSWAPYLIGDKLNFRMQRIRTSLTNAR